ncbi:MAG: TraB/GumN family protein [Pseudomonadota bacterium]
MLLALLLSGTAQAEGLLWQVQGPKAKHWMLGSVHLLPPSAYPLPAMVEYAYRDASGLAFETDIDALTLPETQAAMRVAARDEKPGGLRSQIPAPLYQLLGLRARKIGMPLPPCEGFKPWFCSALLESFAARKAGFDAEYGIDQHFYRRAQLDQKARTSLETPQAQLDLLSGMPDAMAVQMLEATLDESVSESDDPQELLRIWQHSDLPALEKIESGLRKKYPAIHARLLADRNRAWLPELRRLFNSESPQLVIVGALHLVGEQGVPTLLWTHGLAATRMVEKRKKAPVRSEPLEPDLGIE